MPSKAYKAKRAKRYDKEMKIFSLLLSVWKAEFYEPIKEQLTAFRNEKILKLHIFDVESFIPLTDDIDDRTVAYKRHCEYLRAIAPEEEVVLKLLKKMGQPKPIAPERPHFI